MSSDLTFITNEKNQNLKERFEVLIKAESISDFDTKGLRSCLENLSLHGL